MAVTVATRMTGGPLTIGERAGPQQLVDRIEDRRAATASAVTVIAVVDDFGRLLAAVEVAEHPHLFDQSGGTRVAGTPGLAGAGTGRTRWLPTS
ncbi:hypothetical protein ACQP00_20915 [Dactylosporangium sp. CS-047395]|uniref:hypothetical protein n=1 Tax=Dactylosporangium sp. CS-047395 TaxID=3239936 RepID=UPI003D94658A